MALTLIEYLGNKVRANVSSKEIEAAIFDRCKKENITIDDNPYLLDKRITDLMYADVLYFLVAMSPNSTASYSEAHGNYKLSVGSETYNTKRDVLLAIQKIYDTYGDSLNPISVSGISWVNEYD